MPVQQTAKAEGLSTNLADQWTVGGVVIGHMACEAVFGPERLHATWMRALERVAMRRDMALQIHRVCKRLLAD